VSAASFVPNPSFRLTGGFSARISDASASVKLTSLPANKIPGSVSPVRVLQLGYDPAFFKGAATAQRVPWPVRHFGSCLLFIPRAEESQLFSFPSTFRAASHSNTSPSSYLTVRGANLKKGGPSPAPRHRHHFTVFCLTPRKAERPAVSRSCSGSLPSDAIFESCLISRCCGLPHHLEAVGHRLFEPLDASQGHPWRTPEDRSAESVAIAGLCPPGDAQR
jgi:hypothetical protein